jgi:putative ABC transport system permease protein
VVVDRSTAEAADLFIGDRTSVLTGAAPQDMTVVGIATFAGQDNRAGNRTVLFSAATADRLLGGDGRVDGIALLADDGVDQVQLAKRVEALLPAGDQAITGTALAEENGKRTNEDVTFFSLFMTVFAVVALLVGAFIISNTFSILVAQRTRELALLRAIGASARQVRRSVVLEALVVGAVASALGLFAGVGVARGIQALWSVLGITMPDGPLVVSGRSLVISFVVGVVVTVASGSAAGPPGRSGRTRSRRCARSRSSRCGSPAPGRPSAWCSRAGSGVSVVLGILGGVVRWCCWVHSARCSASPPWRRCWPDRWSGCSRRCCRGWSGSAGCSPGRTRCATRAARQPPRRR